MSIFSNDSGLPPEPPVSPAPARPSAAVSAAHRRELSAEELASLPLQALLVRSGRLSIDQLSDALRENVSTGRAVEDIAVSRGWVPAEELEELRRAKAAYAAPEPAPEPPAPAVEFVAPTPPPPASVAPAPVDRRPGAASGRGNARAAGPQRAADRPDERERRERELRGRLLDAHRRRAHLGRPLRRRRGRRAAAQEVIDELMRPEPGVWPRFGNRLVRPDSVVAVEVSKRRED